jgi:hypothetical protein
MNATKSTVASQVAENLTLEQAREGHESTRAAKSLKMVRASAPEVSSSLAQRLFPQPVQSPPGMIFQTAITTQHESMLVQSNYHAKNQSEGSPVIHLFSRSEAGSARGKSKNRWPS